MIIVAKQRRLDMLAALFGIGTIRIGLYSNTVTLDETMPVSAFTPLVATGYAPLTIGTIVYTESGSEIDGFIGVATWHNIAVPYTVQGYYVWNETDGLLCFASNFDGVVTTFAAGYNITLNLSDALDYSATEL